jgi:ribose transport system ATP-binding protein
MPRGCRPSTMRSLRLNPQLGCDRTIGSATTPPLSTGGNQQKVVLAKWIVDGSRVLLLDEPSRGLDVGAKADLYGLVRRLADEGAAVIVASSELEELCAACDSIWVFHEGRNVQRFDPLVTERDEILRVSILGKRD